MRTRFFPSAQLFFRTLLCVALLLLALPLYAQSMTNTSAKGSDEEDDDEEETCLVVNSSPSHADVYLNGRYMGETPLTLTDIKPGNYVLEIKREGYRPERQNVTVTRGETTKVGVTLKEYTGTVIIKPNVEDVKLYVDGKRSSESTNLISLLTSGLAIELSEGIHTICARAFGYIEEILSVTVLRDTIQTHDVTMKNAPFAVTSYNLEKNRFNPGNPGALGKVKISFSVTAPGTARFTVYDSNYTIVSEKDVGPFSTWDNEYTWDGSVHTYYTMSYTEGDTVPDGTYYIEVEFTGEDSQELITKERLAVQIDSSLVYQLAGIGGGGLSAGAVPLALTSPKGAGSFEVAVLAPIDTRLHGVSSIPVEVGIQGVPANGLELSAQGTFFIADRNSQDGGLPVSVGAALKFTTETDSISLGGDVRYRFATRPVGMLLHDRENGLGGDILVGISEGNKYLGGSFGVTFGDSQGRLGNDALTKTKLGATLRLQHNNLSFSVYGAMYSLLGGAGNIALYDGAEVGGEFVTTAGNSSLCLTLGAAGLFDRQNNFTCKLRAGLSLLF